MPTVECRPTASDTGYGVGRDAMTVQPVPQLPPVQRNVPGPRLIAVKSAVVAIVALMIFLVFGTFAYRIRMSSVTEIGTYHSNRWSEIERSRFEALLPPDPEPA